VLHVRSLYISSLLIWVVTQSAGYSGRSDLNRFFKFRFSLWLA